MEIEIKQIKQFTLVGYSKNINSNEGQIECPKFWDEHVRLKRNNFIMGEFALCVDSDTSDGTFKYMICDRAVPAKAYPLDAERVLIPDGLWAVIKCNGPLPKALQEATMYAFNEWLPNNGQFELREKMNIELYSDPNEFLKGINDPNYHSEIWLPIKRK